MKYVTTLAKSVCRTCVGPERARYPRPQERAVVGERHIDENNHALGALRYLISRLDARFIAKLRGKAPAEAPVEVEVIDHTDTQASVYGKKPKQITLMDNPDVWERLI